MSEIQLKEIVNLVFNRCQDIKLFYPLNDTTILIQETENNIQNHDLKSIKIQNMPISCWIFEHEFYQSALSVNTPQRGSFSNMGNRVEKSILWKENNFLYILMLEMKTSIVPKKASEYIEKMEYSLNALSLHLCVNHYFSGLENCVIVPMGVLCYNNDYDCIPSYFEDKSPKFLESDANRTFKKQFVELGKRSFKMSIYSAALNYNAKIPFVFLKNDTDNPNGFSLDFEEIYQKLNTI